MKKFYIFFCLLLLSSSVVFATHNKGGEITYKNMGGFTYEITITTYTFFCPACNPVPPDRTQLDSVFWGDGNRGTILRFDFVDLGDSIRRNRFIAVHTYPGEGIYRIYFIDPNRNLSVANILNSVNVPFCTEAYLVAFDPVLYCVNNSVESQVPPIFTAKVGEPFQHNLAVADPDGDSLSFEFVVPLMALDTPVPGYTLPLASNMLSISSSSGQIRWDSPTQQGNYAFAVKVNEWRYGYKIGYIIRDFQVTVSAVFADTSNVFAPLPLAQDAEGNYFTSVNPGDTVNVHAVYYGSIAAPAINTYGEAFLISNPSVQYSSASGTAIADLMWIPDLWHSRVHPFIFTFRGASTNLKADLTVLVYVTGTGGTCPVFPFIGFNELEESNTELKVFPNPVTSELRIQNSEFKIEKIEICNTLGKKVYSQPQTSNLKPQTVDVSQLPSGIYFVKVKTDERIRVAKFVKE